MAAGAVAAARGTLLGLILGDAVGATGGSVPERGILPATSGGQLACFTVEGLIRADVRGALRGIGHTPSMVWQAYGRWAALQGVVPMDEAKAARWPDGWLADVSILREPRGTAPATVAALRGRPSEAASGATSGATARKSLGPRAVTRVLPVGLYARAGEAAQLAAEVAAITHRDEAVVAAAIGASAVQRLSEGETLARAMATAEEHGARANAGAGLSALTAAIQAGRSAPREAAQLTRFTPDDAAASVLAGGVYVALSFPEPDSIQEALLFAARANDGGHVATVAGTLLGAAHGPDALPVEWLSRLELVWIADTLARDLVRQMTKTPAGTEYAEATDPHWWRRYPGW